MAKRKKSRRPIGRPAAWFRASLAKERAAVERSYQFEPGSFPHTSAMRSAAKQRASRAAEKEYLRASIKTLRRFVKGFEPADGYSTKDTALARITGAKLARIRKLAPQFNRELSRPHVVKRVLSAGQYDGDPLEKHYYVAISRP